MGIISRAIESKSADTLSLFREIYGGRTTSTGKTVNVSTAVEQSTVYGVCRVLGEGVAQVPLKLMQDVGKSKLPAKDHSLFNLLAYKPNRWQTSFEYREMLMWHAVLAGNHYSFINRRGGKIVELYPLDPSTVKVLFDRGTISYEVTPVGGGEPQPFPAEAIWHVRGPSWSGWHGLETVKLARESIAVALAAEEAVGSLHKNGVQPSGVYSVTGTMTPDQYTALSNWVDKHHAGSVNAGKTLILDRQATWLNTQMTSIDAQTMDERRFQIEEICRFANVMPIMIGHSDKTSTYASATAMFHAHYKSTLAPWYQRLEQSMDANLLTDRERAQGYYTSFVEEGWLRGSMTETKDTLLGYVAGGVMSQNEARAKLDMNPDSDPESDKLHMPANIVGATPAPTGV